MTILYLSRSFTLVRAEAYNRQGVIFVSFSFFLPHSQYSYFSQINPFYRHKNHSSFGEIRHLETKIGDLCESCRSNEKIIFVGEGRLTEQYAGTSALQQEHTDAIRIWIKEKSSSRAIMAPKHLALLSRPKDRQLKERRGQGWDVAKRQKLAVETGTDPPLEVVSGSYYWRTKSVWRDEPVAQSGGVSIRQSSNCTGPSLNLIQRNVPQSNVTGPNKSKVAT